VKARISIALAVASLGCVDRAAGPGTGPADDGAPDAGNAAPADEASASDASPTATIDATAPASADATASREAAGAAVDASAADASAADAGAADGGVCGPLPLGPVVVPSYLSARGDAGVTFPSAAGGTVESGLYYLTSQTNYNNPSFSFDYCGGPGSLTLQDTIRFVATSTTAGVMQETTEDYGPDGGVSQTEVLSWTYASEMDAATPQLSLEELCVDAPSQNWLAYTASPTKVTVFTAVSLPYTGQPVWPPPCYTVSVYTKQ